MPTKGRRAVLLGIVSAKPMEMQSGKFPHEFRMMMPERRNHGCWKTIRHPQPVHPSVEFKPFSFQVISAQKVPVDWMRWFRGCVKCAFTEVIDVDLIRSHTVIAHDHRLRYRYRLSKRRGVSGLEDRMPMRLGTPALVRLLCLVVYGQLRIECGPCHDRSFEP